MITCVKGGPRRTDVVKLRGAGEFKGRYTESAEVLCGQITCIQKHVFGLNWAYPPSYRYPRWTQRNFGWGESSLWAGSKVKWPSPFLRKIGTSFSVVTKIRENAPDEAYDLRLVSREPQELFGSWRVFWKLPHSCFTSSNFIGSAKEAAQLFQRLGFIQALASACSLTYVWHFSDRFLWQYYSTRTGGHHHELTTCNATLIDRPLQAGLGCSRDGQRFSRNGSLYSV